eukprot:6466248-Amphidinium_carterae.1
MTQPTFEEQRGMGMEKWPHRPRGQAGTPKCSHTIQGPNTPVQANTGQHSTHNASPAHGAGSMTSASTILKD